MDDQRKVVISGSLAVGLAISMLLVQLASAQSGCTTAIVSLSPCLDYIAGNASTPSSSCCSQLATVVQSEPACLCSVLNGGASSLGVTVNQTRALALPGACGVQTPPASECNRSPTAPETPSTTPSPPATGEGGGSKVTPATTPNAASSYKTTGSLIVSVLFLSVCSLLH
ncbi:non-specific lipid transfer protein GPI-anchored 5-like [Zingiber officinale]|uniref:Bifunctional inhibitor/plant lipid transfer protein/seed storage helical domain-containing protein n=1 Tax=Zingiber officinale TaxID=94328 RepID=A0A8J5KYT7_ZINOF|nr:non-specific lipid transfer protein GPI-anchored 5-like [Zingiber officinale]KAG6494711.1 hypothetical protein ZIOFF_042472 [Zingiber officinale]